MEIIQTQGQNGQPPVNVEIYDPLAFERDNAQMKGYVSRVSARFHAMEPTIGIEQKLYFSDGDSAAKSAAKIAAEIIVNIVAKVVNGG